MPGPNDPLAAEAGLCAGCDHAHTQQSARGSRFWRCLRAEHDDAFRRYPRLPVAECLGFEPRAAHADREG